MPSDPADLPSYDAEDLGDEAASPTLEELREAQEMMRRFVDVIETDGRYPLEAFRFLQEGLDHAVKRSHGPAAGLAQRAEAKEDLSEHPHHVTGRQLCEGIVELALRRWGRMAKTVLGSWNINASSDFGAMVFLLVENDLLQKTERDRQEDFDNVFNFADLERAYEINVEGRTVDTDEVHVAGAA